MENVPHFHNNVLLVQFGIQQTVVFPFQMFVHQDLIIMELNVFHFNHALKEESGMILSHNVYAQTTLFIMVLNVLNVLKVNYIQMAVVSVLKEHSLMDQDVKLKLPINVSVLSTRIGTVLTVFVKADTVQAETYVIVKVSLWEIIVKDVPQSLIPFLEMVSVNVTPVMLILTVVVL